MKPVPTNLSKSRIIIKNYFYGNVIKIITSEVHSIIYKTAIFILSFFGWVLASRINEKTLLWNVSAQPLFLQIVSNLCNKCFLFFIICW